MTGLFHGADASETKGDMVSGLEPLQFFFEDEGKEELYATILEKFIQRLPRQKWGVYCLGGKNNVIRHCRTHPGHLHVVDKDFDDLLGRQVELPNLVYWQHFCVENYLIQDEDAFIQTVSSYSLRSPETLREVLHHADTVNSSVHRLVEFTQAVLVAHKNGVPNIGRLNRFCNVGQGLNGDSIENFVETIFTDFPGSLDVSIDIRTDIQHAPGKLLLCLLIAHAGTVVGLPRNPESFFLHGLALHSPPSVFDEEFRLKVQQRVTELDNP